MSRKGHSFFVITCTVILTAAISSALTALYLLGRLGIGSGALQNYARLETIRRTIEREYYTEIDDDVLMNGAIKGMLIAVGDPYTYYLTPEEAQSRTESETRSYYGLGMTVIQNDKGELEVISINHGSPAELGGLRVDDVITEINAISLKGMELNDAVDLIRNNGDADLMLTVVRGDETLSLEMKPENIPISNVNSCMLENNVGYIQITQFAGTDVEDFKIALDDLIAQGAVGVIIDVRNDPGGYLDHVTAIADHLLPEALIVYTQDRKGTRVDHYSDAEYINIPLCVLVNEGSASASEIFAAAIKDNGRGTVIGTQTFGKGIVQSVYTFEDDGAVMQFTSATYYTPGGICIHGIGVTPDIVEEDPDKQVTIAMEILTGENNS